MKPNNNYSQAENRIDFLMRELHRLSPRTDSLTGDHSTGIPDAITKIIEGLQAIQDEAKARHNEIMELKSVIEIRTAQLTSACEKLKQAIKERSEMESHSRAANALLKILYVSSSRQNYADALVMQIREWSGCECVGIRILENGAIPYHSHVGFTKEFWESENNLLLNRDNCICTRIVAGTIGPQDVVGMTPGGSFQCNSTEAFLSGLDEEERSHFRGVCVKSGFMSLAIVPIQYYGNTIGAVHVADQRVSRIAPGFVRMMEFLAPLIGEAISKLKIRDQLERELEIQKKSEAELQKRRDELAHLSRVVTVGEIATSLAHELNQPLSAILSNSQAALRFLSHADPDLDEVRGALEDIVEDDLRASGIIQRLRSMLKKVRPERVLCDLNGIIQDTLKLVASSAVKREISVTAEIVTDLPKVMGDPVQLQQVLLNLLLNACDSIEKVHPDRRITIKSSHTGSATVEVAIMDTGVGIGPGEICCIFDPFYTTKVEGMGMGLPISRSIIEAHGGTLWATQNPDCGMTFGFSLPVGYT